MIDLKLFCSKKLDDAKFAEPWVAGGFQWASDRIWMAWRKTEAPESALQPEGWSPDWMIHGAPGAFVRPTVLSVPACRHCKEGYSDRRTCLFCNGSGHCTCSHCDHEHDCPDCEGEGHHGPGPCERCSATGKLYETTEYRLLGELVQAKYLDALAGIGAEVALATFPDLNPTPCFFFQAEDVQGVLMPLSSHSRIVPEAPLVNAPHP